MLGAVVINNQHDGRTFATKSRVHNCEFNECDENGKLADNSEYKVELEKCVFEFYLHIIQN